MQKRSAVASIAEQNSSGVDVMKRISYRPIHPAIGAEILNVDLSGRLDPEVMAEVIQVWEENSIVLFRDQNLTPEQQMRVTEFFGVPYMGDHIKEMTEYVKDKPEMHFGGVDTPGILIFSNVKDADGKATGLPTDGELWFHSDLCYLPKTAKASLLYGIQPVAVGGETCFASGYAAYEALSPELKRKLDGVMAEFVLDYSEPDLVQMRKRRAGTANVFRAIHPAVVLHPGTKRPALFINRQTTESFIGMDSDESDALLAQLFDFQESSKFVYEHKWRKNDFVVWDNRSCLHSRKNFDPSLKRVMRRSTAGTVVLEAARLEHATA
jgi:taurine dioxygenase